MDSKTILINIALGFLALVGYFVGYYFYIRAKINKEADGAIDAAEQPDKAGPEKLEQATAQAYALVPPFLKPFISKHLVRNIVQAAFNRIESYAKKQKK